MNTKTSLSFLVVLCWLITAPTVLSAQDDASSEPDATQQETVEDSESQEGSDAEGEADLEADIEDDEEVDSVEEIQETTQDEGIESEQSSEPESPVEPPASVFDDFDDDDFESVDFVPLDGLEGDLLENIAPITFAPHIELNGMFRVRSQLNVNLDLDTEGTSAIAPPVGTYTPFDEPANPDANTLWGSNMRLQLTPTLHLTESLRVHISADIFNNVVLGSMPAYRLGTTTSGPDNRMTNASQLSTGDLIEFTEAYGELQTFFGTIRAGRMDNHWGLGMFANDGDCAHCDYGDTIDRIMLQTNIFGYHLMAGLDFPAEGWVPNTPGFSHGQPYDMGQIDEANQYTIALLKSPQSRVEREQQTYRLVQQRKPVLNGGVYFSYRSQNGEFLPSDDTDISLTNPPSLIYRGLQSYTTDLWLQFLYEPSSGTSMRIELEGIGILGKVDNATSDDVGLVSANDGDQPERINCFDDDIRSANQARCSQNAQGASTSADIQQFGLALESEFYVGGPVGFGINGGFANGGSAPNWGYQNSGNPSLDFYRFNPDYHVDLILFRQVIGTVSNAYYVNPYILARFLESGNQRMEFQFDTIASRAFNSSGTPSGSSAWMGLEFDASLRFIEQDTFQIGLDAGILFPFAALNVVTDRERLLVYGDNPPTFTEDRSASFAWTILGSMIWSF